VNYDCYKVLDNVLRLKECSPNYCSASTNNLILSSKNSDVAALYINIPVWVYFGGPWNGKCKVVTYVHLEYFWFIHWSLVYCAVICSIFPVLACFTKKNLATLGTVGPYE
jgi:hypothetical protein